MDLPSFIDVKRVAEIGLLVLMIIQYFKAMIPVKFIPLASVLVGIGISFGYTAQLPFSQWTPYGVFVTVINGAVGAFGSDTAYSFLSGSKGGSLTLPSKSQMVGTTPPATPPTTGGAK